MTDYIGFYYLCDPIYDGRKDIQPLFQRLHPHRDDGGDLYRNRDQDLQCRGIRYHLDAGGGLWLADGCAGHGVFRQRLDHHLPVRFPGCGHLWRFLRAELV